jgi:hypothetical protein
MCLELQRKTDRKGHRLVGRIISKEEKGKWVRQLWPNTAGPTEPSGSLRATHLTAAAAASQRAKRHGTAGAISPPTGNGYPFAAPEATPPLPSPATPQPPRRGGIQANHPLHHAVPSSLSPCVQIPRSIELSPGGGGIPFGHRFAFSTGADPSIDRSISASRNQSVADSVRPGRRRTVN